MMNCRLGIISWHHLEPQVAHSRSQARLTQFEFSRRFFGLFHEEVDAGGDAGDHGGGRDDEDGVVEEPPTVSDPGEHWNEVKGDVEMDKVTFCWT